MDISLNENIINQIEIFVQDQLIYNGTNDTFISSLQSQINDNDSDITTINTTLSNQNIS
jgi:hypothetical protein